MQQNSRSRRNVHDRRWTESRRTLEAMSDVLLAAAVVAGVAAVTTGKFDRAWAVRLNELAQDAVGRCGLAQENWTPAAPDPWTSLLRDEQGRRDREVSS